jgi:hypothetical protein
MNTNGLQYGKRRLAERVPVPLDKSPKRTMMLEFTAFCIIFYIV